MNLKLLNSLEKDIGIPLISIDEKTFIEKITQDKIQKKYFSSLDDTIEILNFIKSNPDLEEFAKSTFLRIEIFKSEEFINELFSHEDFQNTKNHDKFFKQVLEKIESGSDIESISMALCYMIAINENISKYYDILDKNIKSLFNRMVGLPISRESYSVHCDILDVIIQFKYYWESNYDSKFTVDGLDDHLNKLHDFEFSVLENSEMKKVNLKPEDLNLIDITKLGKKGDEE